MTHLLPTTCGGVKLAASQIGVKAKIAPMLDGGDVELALKTGALTMPGTRLGAITAAAIGHARSGDQCDWRYHRP
jgi:hypothetical protein